MQNAANQALSSAYESILTDENLSSLSQVEAYLGEVFLPSAPAKPVSLMVIGRESSGSRRRFRKIQNIALSNTLQPRLSAPPVTCSAAGGLTVFALNKSLTGRNRSFKATLWQEAPCPFVTLETAHLGRIIFLLTFAPSAAQRYF